jgi:hypothetical protein
MDEAKMFRRAFAVGLLLLGASFGGQMVTSRLEARSGATACSVMRPVNSYSPYARLAARPDGTIVQRVARAVIGAVLSSFA